MAATRTRNYRHEATLNRRVLDTNTTHPIGAPPMPYKDPQKAHMQARLEHRARGRAFRTLKAQHYDEWQAIYADLYESSQMRPGDTAARFRCRMVQAAHQELTSRHPTDWTIHRLHAHRVVKAEHEQQQHEMEEVA